MRAFIGVILAGIALAAPPALAETSRPTFAWKSVQALCNATAAKPASAVGQRIAQNAIDEFYRFGGHQVDSHGRMFHFGAVEADQEPDDLGSREPRLAQLGWWQVMKYWRSLYGNNSADMLDVIGYPNASAAAQDAPAGKSLHADASRLLQLVDGISDPEKREVLREAALRSAIMDTPWSAAFVSYVVKQAGVAPTAFKFSNAHRTYLYDAFATSAAETKGPVEGVLYRACPLDTRPRAGDLLCFHRELALVDDKDDAVRERIMGEVVSGTAGSVRRLHCDVVAYIDTRARRAYVIGGNIYQSITVKKLRLHTRRLRIPAVQKGNCRSDGRWTLPMPSADVPRTDGRKDSCSLNDKKWFVLLQVR